MRTPAGRQIRLTENGIRRIVRKTLREMAGNQRKTQWLRAIDVINAEAAEEDEFFEAAQDLGVSPSQLALVTSEDEHDDGRSYETAQGMFSGQDVGSGTIAGVPAYATNIAGMGTIFIKLSDVPQVGGRTIRLNAQY